MASTTSLGGAAQGVLGAMYRQNITIVDVGNWYLGSDPAAIGSGQYDFQTAVTHELGHALGLAHSPDPASVMYFSLSPATVKRDLSPSDMVLLNDVENAPEPLMAAPFVHGL